jgi:hypothetical protein
MLLTIILSLFLNTLGSITVNDLQAKKIILLEVELTVTDREPSFEPDSMTINRALKGYLAGLEHPIDGVVESAIYQSMMLSIMVPSANMMEIRKKLKELSLSHPAQSIRVRAFLAHEFFADSEYRKSIQYTLMNRKAEQEPAEIFKNLSERLSAQALKRFK